MTNSKQISIFVIWSLLFGASLAFASETNGTIVSGGNNGYAWSNQAGWINFGCSNCGISIADSGITGRAWSNNYGWINMSPANGGVTVAANGALSGYAWGSGLGWINFSGVSINSSGKFVGTASGTNVGALTFNCANCSVTTDFRAQSFRTVAPAPTTAVFGGGSVVGSGPNAPSASIPSHINAYNVPMELYPTQSGTLTQNLTTQKKVTLDVPSNVFSDELTFIAREETITSTIVPTITVIGNTIFDVTARDKAGNLIHTLSKPIKIALNISELLRGRTDLGVYFFDEAARVWVKIHDAVFSGDSVSFSVDHLTLFAIFAGPELPLTIEAPFQLPPQFQFEIQRGGVETSREGVEVPAEEAPSTEITSEEKPPLFDIKVGPGTLESKSKTKWIFIISVLTIVGLATTIYIFLKKRRNAKQRDEI